MRQARRIGGVVAVVAVLAVLAALVGGVVAGWRAWHSADNPFAAGEECTATVDGHAAALDPEQARWAGLIVAVSIERGLPARAASIALATAFQESDLYNLHYGDRDSVGLFQQRPSQGWGTRAQLLDPRYATEAFYAALVRVDGYTSMSITQAAQAVQRSGFPTAYADHEADARVLASALTGHSAHAFTCRLGDPDPTGRTRAVRADLGTAFAALPVAADDGGGGQVAVTATDPTRGWAVAQYLVSQAHRLRLSWVSYDGRTWRAGDRSADGWTADASTSGPGRVRLAVAG